jgi:hypothetical protein
MLKTKFQVALLAIAVMALGLAPAGDAVAGSCKSDRSYDRLHHSKHHYRGHDRWHNRSRGVSYHYSSRSHHDYSRSRAKVSYRNDNVRFSVSVGSGHSYGHHRQYDYHRPRYHRDTSCSQTVVYHTPQPTGYWKRVYHGPVYETRYDDCGRPYRVCVRAGYYERVWVSTGHRY